MNMDLPLPAQPNCDGRWKWWPNNWVVVHEGFLLAFGKASPHGEEAKAKWMPSCKAQGSRHMGTKSGCTWLL